MYAVNPLSQDHCMRDEDHMGKVARCSFHKLGIAIKKKKKKTKGMMYQSRDILNRSFVDVIFLECLVTAEPS